MVAPWLIRKATATDSEGLQDCMESAYAPYQVRMGGKRLPPMDLDYSDELNQNPTWIADSNGSVAGGLIMVFKNDFALIANIAVHPEFQGQRLGGELLKFAESLAKEKGCSEMRLATHPKLTEIISLYKHLGWKEFDRDDKRVRMKKKTP